MKKKPEQYTRQGKTNNNIKSFLSNLKENDLHFEDNQITQCVFLGVLRLKPVPSVFNSNNLPSVVVENKTKKHKNNNSTKEVNKNISAKRDINKVISGKIRKKNPDTIKASVKKLATKKPVIKIKFNVKKNKKESSKDTVTIMQDSLTKITPQNMLQNKTITLNPIQTTPSFNPVQNLFDKLKQQMDEKYNRPGTSDVTKEILFSSEVNADNQKGSKKSKKPPKKKAIFERLVMPLLPSNTSFTDNGYYSSTSSVNTKTGDEVIVINEENGDSDDEDDDDDEEVLVNTGPMPNFVLRTTSIDDDVIVINDRSTPNMDHLVIDDNRSTTRTSPRLNRNDSNLQKSTINNNQEQTNIITINENNTYSEAVVSSSKQSSEKPRKRRTLLPTIPLNFFNTSMLLRSELAQKKGGGTTEGRSSSRASTSKVQKSENKQEKSLLKQRKDKSESKTKNATENLIYEVVKSSTAVSDHSILEKKVKAPQNDVILIDKSPPKVEPLIIKLKLSNNKNSNDRSQKSEVAKITKNLFFPRLLRSDVTQQKPNKEKDDITVKKPIYTAEIIPPPPTKTSSRKEPVKLNISKELVAVELPKKDEENTLEKNATVLHSPLKEKPAEKNSFSSNNKKIEKSPDSKRRQLKSVVVQDKNTTDDSREKGETSLIIEKSDEGKHVIRKPRAQKKTVDPEVIIFENPAPNQEKPAPNQEKPAQKQEKPAPSQEKPAPSQEKPAPKQDKQALKQVKPAPEQEKPASNLEKTTPKHEKLAQNPEPAQNQEKPVKENLVADQTVPRQLRSNQTPKNSNEIVIVDQTPVTLKSTDFLQKQSAVENQKTTRDIGVINVAQFYTSKEKSIVKRTITDESQKKSTLDRVKDYSSNNQPRKKLLNKKNIVARRPLRSDHAQKESVDSEIGKMDKKVEKSKKEVPKGKSVDEPKDTQTKPNEKVDKNIKIVEEPIPMKILSKPKNTEVVDKNSKIVEEPKKILFKSKNIEVVDKNSKNVEEPKKILLKPKNTEVVDKNSKIVEEPKKILSKPKNTEILDKNSKTIEESKKILLKPQNTEVVRKLRSELTQKEITNKDDKILKPSDPDVQIFNTESAQETSKIDSISKTKKVVSRLIGSLEIDLVDYANLSVDTAIPRRLRSEFAQKNDDADEIVDAQEKPVELLSAKIETEQLQQKTEVVQNSSSDVEKHIVDVTEVPKGKTNNIVTIEKIKRNRSLSKSGIDKPTEVANVGVDDGNEAIKILNKIEEKPLKNSKMIKKVSKQINLNSKESSNEKPKRKYTKRVKNPFSNKEEINTEVSRKIKKEKLTNLSAVSLNKSKKSADTLNIKNLKINRSVTKTRTKSVNKTHKEAKNKDKPVEKVAKKKERVTFKINTVKKAFKQTKKLLSKTKIIKNKRKNADNNKTILLPVEIVSDENEIKIKVEKSDEQIVQKNVKTKLTKANGDENVQQAVTKKTVLKINKPNKIVKKTIVKQNKIKLLGKIGKRSSKVQPEVKPPRKRGRPKKTEENIVTNKKVAVLTEAPKQQKIKPIQKKQDLDEITVVPEKKAKKQKDGPVRMLRSSFAPIVIKEEPKDEKPIAIVEKVVALIHSEPKPKILEEPTETKPVIVVKKEKIKPRILRSQNFNQIETINEIKEVLPPKEATNKKNIKNEPKKTGVLPKSKTLAKKNKQVVSKRLRSDVKTKTEKPKASKKELKRDLKTTGRTKIDQLTKNSKKKVIQQVKSKLKTTKIGNPLKKSEPKKKPVAKQKTMLNWRNDEIIERIIQELKNSLFNKDGIENKMAKDQNTTKKNLTVTMKKSKKILKKTSKPSRKLLLAKKKLMQKKAALQRKLRSARLTETAANTSSGSESKENNPPKSTAPSESPSSIIIDDVPQTKSEDTIKEETTVHLVDSYLEEIKDNDAEKKTKSINIITDVTVQSNGKIVEKPVKRKHEDATPGPTVSKRRHFKSIITGGDKSTKLSRQNTIDLTGNLSKTKDITVFDFDESEPELAPLRRKTTPKSKTDEPTIFLKSTETQTTPEKRPEKPVAPTQRQISSAGLKRSETEIDLNKRKSEASAQTDDDIVIADYETPIKNERTAAIEASTSFQVDKDQILLTDKFISDFDDALLSRNQSKKKPQIIVPAYDEEGNPRRLWSIIKSPKPDVEPPPPSPPPPPQEECITISDLKPKPSFTTSTSKDVEESIISSPESLEKKSPLKQATIIEMFHKVWMKRDTVKHDLFSTPVMAPPPAPKAETPKNFPIFGTCEAGFKPAAPSPRRDRPPVDDDSDSESRIEWIPEEYAEYKLKYSVQKMMQYKPLFRCKICLIKMPTYYKLLKHRKEHDTQDRPHVCPHCGSEFREVEDFSAHLRVHKGKHPYMCHKCDLGFWTKKAFEAHAPVHMLRKVNQPVKKFRCDVCAKEFSKLCDVERHTRVHTGEKPCVCNICNKGFVQAHNLSKHLLTHLHIKPFICEICSKQFGRNDVLRRHLLTHSVQKPIKCSVCDKGFIRQSQLLQHMRRKHPGVSVEGLTDASDDEESIKNEDISNEEGKTSKVKS